MVFVLFKKNNFLILLLLFETMLIVYH